MPPQRIASATCPAGAARTRSQSGKWALSWANARSELMSEVCWDNTVAIISSMIGSRGLGTNGPWLARSSRCTSVMARASSMLRTYCGLTDRGKECARRVERWSRSTRTRSVRRKEEPPVPDRKVLFGVGLGAWNGADAASAADSVQLVVQADRDGLDLFTVADHPYFGQKLDAYALVSFL